MASLPPAETGELSTLRGRRTDIGATTVKDATTPLTVSGGTLELQADLTAGTAARFGLNVRTGGKQRTRIGYDSRQRAKKAYTRGQGGKSDGIARHLMPLSTR
ncbi:GH32 C-terminal domain-containing protein [Streptomyces sp. NPDC054834]